jgi:23S rRNA G2445 N2-methylase RlmL
MEKLFAVCTPGLEPFAAQELHQLGLMGGEESGYPCEPGGIEFSRRSISAIEPPSGPGWVVTNPPYGVRVSKPNDLRNLYAHFGKVVRAKCPGWQVTLICDRVQSIRNTGLDFDKGIPTMNGGLKVRLVRSLVKSRLTS